ncbi:collagen alpha-1(II) chain-like [Passer montanus]|uniref:collagen alpha-1(II) chain-like n=1 Tax=Passer montanus TaxID=9160 RepID=UPI00195F861A|nr:collagen alpha-1(II) chain-like [Passer montanus]
MTGLMRELRYPSHVKKSKMAMWNQQASLQIGITKLMMKKGSQHTMKAPKIIPKVFVAFRSLAAVSFFFSSRASETFTFTWFMYTGEPVSLDPSGALEFMDSFTCFLWRLLQNPRPGFHVDPPVQGYEQQSGEVEGSYCGVHGVQDVVRVHHTVRYFLSLRLPPKQRGHGDADGEDPYQCDHARCPLGSPFRGVLDGVGDRPVAVQGDDTEVQDGRRATGDVRGQPDIADDLTQRPPAGHSVHGADGHDKDGDEEVGDGQRGDQVVGRRVEFPRLVDRGDDKGVGKHRGQGDQRQDDGEHDLPGERGGILVNHFLGATVSVRVVGGAQLRPAGAGRLHPSAAAAPADGGARRGTAGPLPWQDPVGAGEGLQHRRAGTTSPPACPPFRELRAGSAEPHSPRAREPGKPGARRARSPRQLIAPPPARGARRAPDMGLPPRPPLSAARPPAAAHRVSTGAAAAPHARGRRPRPPGCGRDGGGCGGSGAAPPGRAFTRSPPQQVCSRRRGCGRSRRRKRRVRGRHGERPPPIAPRRGPCCRGPASAQHWQPRAGAGASERRAAAAPFIAGGAAPPAPSNRCRSRAGCPPACPRRRSRRRLPWPSLRHLRAARRGGGGFGPLRPRAPPHRRPPAPAPAGVGRSPSSSPAQAGSSPSSFSPTRDATARADAGAPWCCRCSHPVVHRARYAVGLGGARLPREPGGAAPGVLPAATSRRRYTCRSVPELGVREGPGPCGTGAQPERARTPGPPALPAGRGAAQRASPAALEAPPLLGRRGQEQRERTFVQVPQLLPAFVLSSRRKVLHTKGVRACFLLGQDNSKLGEMRMLQPN